jgi:hypothetical protein
MNSKNVNNAGKRTSATASAAGESTVASTAGTRLDASERVNSTPLELTNLDEHERWDCYKARIFTVEELARRLVGKYYLHIGWKTAVSALMPYADIVGRMFLEEVRRDRQSLEV